MSQRFSMSKLNKNEEIILEYISQNNIATIGEIVSSTFIH